MKIHEYQAKELFRKYKVRIPEGGLAFTPGEAAVVAERIGRFPVVVKAQIHAGGRGKGGGVKLADSVEDVRQAAGEIIGMNLVTPQTGPEGRLVKKVLVERGLNIKKELYLGFVPDRATAKVLIMASEAGGMDIEKVAEETPEKVIRVYVNPLLGIQPFHCRELAFGLNLTRAVTRRFNDMLENLYRLFLEYDCSLLEINPLVITARDTVVALDAKINLDDNAVFRHGDIAGYRDFDEEDPLDVEASRFNLNYINMGGDGNIGDNCLFLSPTDPRLSEGSPCIDAGTSAILPDTDLGGSPRLVNGTVDMGAYEYQGP